MGENRSFCSVILVVLLVACASGEDPYRFYNWNVTYGDIYPLGVKQQVASLISLLFLLLLPHFFFLFLYVLINIYFVKSKWQGILINGQFPGPQIDSVTNDNLIISVFNSLDEPFLLSWLVLFLFFLSFFLIYLYACVFVYAFSHCELFFLLHLDFGNPFVGCIAAMNQFHLAMV
jgi:hypothetical protein